MSRAEDIARAEVAALIEDLQALMELPPADRVRRLGAWLVNSGEPESIRTRLSGVRALAAAEVQADGLGDLPGRLGLKGLGPAYELAAKGREILSQARRDSA